MASSLDAVESVLQVYLANDNAAVQHLPSVLTALNSAEYARSPHLRKFCARLNALIHAKEAAPRWAGVLIAQHAFRLNKDAVLDNAHAWVTAVLPLLSVRAFLLSGPHAQTSIAKRASCSLEGLDCTS